MTAVHHVRCGSLLAPHSPLVVCHCLLLEDGGRLALVDAGIGVADARDPEGRVGPRAIAMAGFRFDEADTAVRRVEERGFTAADVTDVVLTHGDADHAGGLADFPRARVHLAAEEHAAITGGNPRYRPPLFAHGPDWRPYPTSGRKWFGLEARPVALGFAAEVLLIPLFGHTPGHCGVAVRQGDGWLLHAGDAYYLRVELATDAHPVSRLAAQLADDDARRKASLEELRRLHRDHAGEVELFGYHDAGELPGMSGV